MSIRQGAADNMLLYHFTSSLHLPAIVKYGLTRGDIPLSPFGPGENGVWLTTNSCRYNQQWSSGSIVDKSEIRLTVMVPEDENLVYWPDYAREKKVEPDWYGMLNEVANFQSKNWWIYLGTIAPDRISCIDSKNKER